MKKILVLGCAFLLSACVNHQSARSLYNPLYEGIKNPEVQFEFQSEQMQMTFSEALAFGSEKATLSDAFQSDLTAMAQFLNQHESVQVQITAYTYASSEKSAKALSLRRVNAISNFLRLQNVDVNRIQTQGYGQIKTKQMNHIDILLKDKGEK